jgi:hypothetical protein
MALDFPTSPANGATYSGYTYDATKGVWVINSSTITNMTVSDTAPSNPLSGDSWFDSTTGYVFVYYTDADSSQWVQTTGAYIDTALTNRVTTVENTRPLSNNYIINGGFDIWQRGTSLNTGAFTYRADRFLVDQNVTSERSTDVPSGAGVGYSMQISAGAGAAGIRQAIELPGTSIAGEFSNDTTWTISFYAKSATARDLSVSASFRAGIVGTAAKTVMPSVVIGTTQSSWARFSHTFTIPSGSISSANCLAFVINAAAGASSDVYFTGVQLEVGSVATPFRRNANSIQGELAACQRYYYRAVAGVAYGAFGLGFAASGTSVQVQTQYPVSMRTAPTAIETLATSNYVVADGVSRFVCSGSFALDTTQTTNERAIFTISSSGLTTYRPYAFTANNNVAAYLGFSAEL